MLRALIATVLLVGHSVAVPTRIAQADDLQKVVTQNRFKMLFMDAENIASKSGDVQLVANKANKQGRVIEPTEPWETWAVFGYNTVIHWGPGDIRMYYDCIASKEGHFGSRFTCLATSADGVTWTKPVLNLATFNGSTENNIVWPLAEGQTWEPGTVFVDTNPAVPDSERVKMIGTWHSTGGSGMYVFASSDGLAFKPLYDKPSLVGSDTKNVAWYDATLGKYVGYMRLDTATPLEHNVTCPAGGLVRRIGRCTFDSLEAWGCDPKNATDIFTFDQSDPPCVDVYTSSATEYEGSILFFPAMYSHMTLATKFGNDGMLDIRFAFAQNTSAPAIYPNAQNARSPFVRLGVDRCRELEPAVYPSRMLFCRDDQTKQFTDFDSVAMYMASGYVLSADGGELMLYYSGQSFTHGDDAGSDVWGTNSGIGLATIRLDGFVSVDAGYDFATPPTVTTAPIPIPSDCPSVTSCGGLSTGCPVFSANVSCTSNSQCAGYTCDGGHTATCNQGVCTTNQSLVCQAGGPILRVNIETSVAGYALAQLHTGDRVVEGADLGSSDAIRGNFLSLPLSWNGAAILGGLQGQKVQLMLEMVDAKLYSVEATCHS